MVFDETIAGLVDLDGPELLPNKVRATNWSRCDAHCTHGGPVRYRYPELGEHWHNLEVADPEQIRWIDGSSLEVEAAWRILTVHHLNGNKADLRWWNLTSLCQRCHLEVQGKVDMARLYVFEHTDWFKPYAAGWYAHIYLGEDLTREETMARLGELLELERMV